MPLNAIYGAVAPTFSAYGVPDYVWQSIADMESSFNPRAVGDNGRSFGLFQLFTAGGQGDSYTGNPEVLFNPTLNAKVAAPEIARAYNTARAMGISEGPDLAGWVAANSGHPGYGLPLDDPAVSIVRERAATYYKGATAAPIGTASAEIGAADLPWWQKILPMPRKIEIAQEAGRPTGFTVFDPESSAQAQQEAKDRIADALPFTTKEWWTQLAGYAVVIVIGGILIVAAVSVMIRPGPAEA